jgi:hypothetical protein
VDGRKRGQGHHRAHTFSFVYAGWRSRRPTRREDIGPVRRGDLVKAVTFIAVASFAVRLVWPFLATDELWGLNLREYPQMLAFFAVGALAPKSDTGSPTGCRRTCDAHADERQCLALS